jgi:hypothetical protein
MTCQPRDGRVRASLLPEVRPHEEHGTAAPDAVEQVIPVALSQLHVQS